MSGIPVPRPPLWREEFPVREDEERVPAHRCAMPSTTTGSPRNTV